MDTRASSFKVLVIILILVSLLASLTPLLPRAYADEPTGSRPLSSLPPRGNPLSTPLAYAAGMSKLYLPLLLKAGTSPGTTPTPPTSGGSGAFFLPWVINGDAQATDGPSIAVDGSGGVHVAYAAYTASTSGKRLAYYVYCASNCNNAANFGTPVALGDKVDHVNLALDSAGHPRIVWVGGDLNSQKLNAYYYATCNSGCTSAGGWSATRVLGTDTTLAHNSRFFALDSQGRPRFVSYEDWCDGNCPVNKGTFLVYCDTGCMSPASWYKNQIISEQEFALPSLALTSTGHPRLAASYLDVSVNPAKRYAIYVECDSYCATGTIGAAFDIYTCTLCNEPGGYFRLRLDSSNRPRLALYTGAVPAGSALEANKLYYLWCNTTCGNASSNDWNGYSLGLPGGVGTYVDLALGPQNRPRLAYEDVTKGLVYAWCTVNCETTASQVWQNTLVDSSDALDASEPVPPIPPCAVASWFTGKRASLAFDTSGNPRIAFDAEHWQGLDPVTNPPGSPGCPGFRMDQINARLAVLNQP
jgi:hypothetical protein